MTSPSEHSGRSEAVLPIGLEFVFPGSRYQKCLLYAHCARIPRTEDRSRSGWPAKNPRPPFSQNWGREFTQQAVSPSVPACSAPTADGREAPGVHVGVHFASRVQELRAPAATGGPAARPPTGPAHGTRHETDAPGGAA